MDKLDPKKEKDNEEPLEEVVVWVSLENLQKYYVNKENLASSTFD